MRLIGPVLKKPIKGMYAIAEHPGLPVGFAVLLLILAFAVSIASKAVVNFIFTDARFEELNLLAESLRFYLPWVSWIIANLLVGSIMKGEGSLRKIIIGNAYALLPFVLFSFPVNLFSRVLTLQEAVLYYGAINGMQYWMLALFFIATQAVHNYNTKEALGMATVSVLTMLGLWVSTAVFMGLNYQAIDFFLEFGRELIDRV